MNDPTIMIIMSAIMIMIMVKVMKSATMTFPSTRTMILIVTFSLPCGEKHTLLPNCKTSRKSGRICHYLIGIASQHS